MKNLLVETAAHMWSRLSLGLFAVPDAYLAGNAPLAELPLTGGDGPLVVTAIGISMAVISLILLFVMRKSGRKSKDKSISQPHNIHHVPPPNAPAGKGHARR